MPKPEVLPVFLNTLLPLASCTSITVLRPATGRMSALASESERTGIPSLKVGFNKVFGYYLEVTAAQLGKVPEEYIRKQTLKNQERYVTPELKEHDPQFHAILEKIWGRP